jgi:hypothetical protein
MSHFSTNHHFGYEAAAVLEKSKMAVFRALMMETARTSETLVNFYQITRRYNPEDRNLRTHRRENLKSYLDK